MSGHVIDFPRRLEVSTVASEMISTLRGITPKPASAFRIESELLFDHLPVGQEQEPVHTV